ncbi:MAG TPA: RNA polymerase factor sigma-54 [Humisphaera sp.]|jgi:RNA polymerase sigma-54 factor|nr:RNA polymerase factor sigma-54 [Humisphaera sp.]
MQLTQSLGMRPELRQILTPRMIQSMEILQLPLQKLEERIEQELQNNPVLELTPGETDLIQIPDSDDNARADRTEDERALVVKDGGDSAADFERLNRLSDYLESDDFQTNTYIRPSSYDGERDKKLDAMNNTAARGATLTEHLLGQWAFVECPPAIRRAGEAIINSIDAEGYFRADFEIVSKESKTPLPIADLQEALRLVQTLEPAGIGARNLRECLMLQLEALENDEEASRGHDFELERALITEHLKDLEMNRYPQISKRLGRSIEDIQAAVHRLSRLHPYPGKQIGGDDAPSITPDALIYYDEDTDAYEIEMTNDPSPGLSISAKYRKWLKDKKQDKKTREFLANNMRNARWLLESIEQRKSTIMRVIRAVVDAQRDFFDKGPEHLRPLPMIQVADQLGIHVATVSRAVSEKWIQTPRGVFPLRRFFSGGTTSADGEDMSWDAVKEKLKGIVDDEDKKNPLNDDEIVEKLKAQGIDLARRTVAKYRKILHIATARQRRQF